MTLPRIIAIEITADRSHRPHTSRGFRFPWCSINATGEWGKPKR